MYFPSIAKVGVVTAPLQEVARASALEQIPAEASMIGKVATEDLVVKHMVAKVSVLEQLATAI